MYAEQQESIKVLKGVFERNNFMEMVQYLEKLTTGQKLEISRSLQQSEKSEEILPEQIKEFEEVLPETPPLKLYSISMGMHMSIPIENS